jgi:hypothetical protein
MEGLYRDGNSPKQIPDHLNGLGLRKLVTDNPYNSKDVSMSLLKYRKRLERNDPSTVLKVSESLILIPLKIVTKP